MQRSQATLVLIHGLWMTPRSWDAFRSLYEARGYRVLTPAWPRMHGDVEEIRRHPAALAGLGLHEVVEHYAAFLAELDEPPILIGHSMGGLVVQLLLDRKFGRAGVAIDSATPKGIYRLPFSVLKSSAAVLGNPFNYWRTVSLTFAQFRYAFAHVMPEAEARAAYERYAVPGPARPIFEVAMSNFIPGAPNRVHWKSDARAPLLLVAGAEDHLVPAALNRINYAKYRGAPELTSFKEFPHRSHFIIGQSGWQEVADYALQWAENATLATANVG